MQITTVTIKGQITLPAEIRKKRGIKPGDKVQVREDKGEIKVEPIPDFFALKGSLKSKKKYDKRKAREVIGRYLAKKYLKTLEG